MTPQPAFEPSAAPAKPMSEISRILNVFVSPKEAFQDILERPRWFIPVVIGTLLALLLTSSISQKIGWERIVRQQMEQSSQTASLSPADKEQRIAMGVKIAGAIGYVQAIVAPLLGTLIVGAILMFVANGMLGTQLRYPQMLGITGYAFLTGLISVPLMILVMNLKNPEDFDIRNPLAFNLGAFLTGDTIPKWVTTLASSIDLFSFWTMFLLAVGIACAGRKLTTGKALTAVLIPWGVWVILKTGWAALF